MSQRHGDHAFYHDEDIEEWLKDKDEEQWAELASLDFSAENKEFDLDEFLKVLTASQDSSPPQPEVLVPAPSTQVSTVDVVPTRQRVVVPAHTAQVPTPQRLLGSVSASAPAPTAIVAAAEVPPPHRKKYTHWTKEEQRSFLYGLQKCGKGNWKRISEQFVPSKTPTQVASHAQKYFQRKNAPKEKRNRRSIHDTTLEDIDMTVTSHFDQDNWVPPPLLNFAMQSHEMHQAIRLLQPISSNGWI